MKQIELTKSTKLSELVKNVRKEDVVITEGGSAVAILSGFDDDDLAWYRRERSPEFIESIAEARKQVKSGHSVNLQDLKKELGIGESFEDFLWKEISRLIPWPKLKRRLLQLVGDQSSMKKQIRKKNCIVRFERISVSAVRQLLDEDSYDHEGNQQCDEDDPIIVFKHNRKKRLLEGAQRCRRWISTKREGPFPSIEISLSPPTN